METYITPVNYTGEGVQHMDESPERPGAARSAPRRYGRSPRTSTGS